MSVEELKKEAINQINELDNEAAVKEILSHLQKLNRLEDKDDVENIFKEAIAQYGNVLKKLAE